METAEAKITQISVEDLTVKLKEHQFFRVRYFAKKHNDYIVRMGIVDDKMRLWEDSKEEICFTYFDLQQNGYRTAKNIDYIQTASLRKEALNWVLQDTARTAVRSIIQSLIIATPNFIGGPAMKLN